VTQIFCKDNAPEHNANKGRGGRLVVARRYEASPEQDEQNEQNEQGPQAEGRGGVSGQVNKQK